MSCSDWREVKVSDVIEMNPRLTLKKGTLAKKIAMKDLAEFNRKIKSYEITEFTSGTKFQNGDTLLARITPCLENGKTAYVDILEEGEVAFGSTEFIVLRAKLGITDDKFVYYLSISPDFRNVAIKSMTGSSGRQRVQNSVLANTSIKIPPLEEQKRIANILSSFDDKIELNNELNKTLEEIAQAIFKHWFVDFEFPNENGEPYKSSGGKFVESELGMIPETWKVQRIDKVTKVNIGKTPPRKEKQWFSKESNDIRWISIKDLGGSGLYILNTSECLTKEAIERFNIKIIPNDTVVLSFKLTVGRVAITIGEKVSNEAIAHFLINDKKISSEYLYLYLKRFNYNTLGSTSSIATAINSKIVKSIPIIVPEENVINKFQEKIEPLFKLIKENIIETYTLENLRDALLPKLMSGQIRIPEAEEVVESCLQRSN